MTTQRPVLNFLRHYIEMVIAMFLGMVVLGGVFILLFALIGIDVADWDTDAPELALLGMAFTMTVPMVAWMRHRGHGWAPAREMAAAMFLPALAGIVVLRTGLVDDFGMVMGLEHVAMLGAMLVAMLLRRDEYSAPHQAH